MQGLAGLAFPLIPQPHQWRGGAWAGVHQQLSRHGDGCSGAEVAVPSPEVLMENGLPRAPSHW